MIWDAEAILKCRQAWDSGLSTRDIGRALGVSKNAIVGKAHRLGFPARSSPIKARDPSAPKPVQPPRAARATLPPLTSAAGSPSVSSITGSRTGGGAPVARRVSVPPVTLAPLPATLEPLPTPPPVIAAPPPAPPAPVPVRRSNSTCCWPIGEPGTKAFRYCDDAAMAGKVYCEEHARIAYVPIVRRVADPDHINRVDQRGAYRVL